MRERKHVSVRKDGIRPQFSHGTAEKPPHVAGGMEIDFLFSVHINRDARVLQLLAGARVVEVRVRQQNRRNPAVFRLRAAQDLIGVSARVDDEHLPRGLVADQIGIDAQRARVH